MTANNEPLFSVCLVRRFMEVTLFEGNFHKAPNQTNIRKIIMGRGPSILFQTYYLNTSVGSVWKGPSGVFERHLTTYTV